DRFELDEDAARYALSTPRVPRVQQALMLRATGACCLMPSDTRVMPPKIQPRLLRCRRLARLGRPSQVRASRTSSYPLTVEKALKSTHTILRRAFFA